ncbi:CPBP family intramembrane metalloprotease [Actinomadura sp. LD22]|uniref:CPBP family intramembrane metalloprotease n=1 Tax=Actinomadura physcomitrii TaxID=2650748 RepID=A0A6I4MI28_9ACTN|nr:CPBP family intramembrane glutamic endopeptidase [Actinomadura physcomitrii]MWA05432.1 CPBP family intramembrane metalloprotease [Actinomadura physcomitrii]
MDVDTLIGGAFAVVLGGGAATALFARWKRGAPLGLGIRNGCAREIAGGLVIGGAAMGATVAAILVCTDSHLQDVRLDASRLGYATTVLVAAAVGEEVVYRALMLNSLARLTRRPLIGLALSAAIFGVVHLTGSPNATAISVLSNSMGGLMYGVAYLRTGRIWLPVGIHFAWNYLQGTVIGFPISDETAYSGALVHPAIQGPTWLTGGGYGPEGSVFSLLFRTAVIAAVLAFYQQSSDESREEPQPIERLRPSEG